MTPKRIPRESHQTLPEHDMQQKEVDNLESGLEYFEAKKNLEKAKQRAMKEGSIRWGSCKTCRQMKVILGGYCIDCFPKGVR